ncbi:hypothetical protein B0A55_04007 [Friedmanniomyces simplex]|uniref:Uncharacterized protein n=1 Tax=Friedmanniomyces simplex TaxID=329884 RepID=A0A4U0XKD2_9PEZI|nr:hypothetical protein B0A55_04007 [Friedmanniomyces simplex]
MYATLLTSLKAKADVVELSDRDQAYNLFTLAADNNPDIVLATNAALTDSKFTSVRRKACEYVRSHGGTLIFMGIFSSFARPLAIRVLFHAFGLPGESGDYHRTTFEVNPAATHVDTRTLVIVYSQKALHLANVEQGDAIYLPSSASRTRSMVFAPRAVDLAQTPAVLGACGRVKVGYLGDVKCGGGDGRGCAGYVWRCVLHYHCVGAMRAARGILELWVWADRGSATDFHGDSQWKDVRRSGML